MQRFLFHTSSKYLGLISQRKSELHSGSATSTPASFPGSSDASPGAGSPAQRTPRLLKPRSLSAGAAEDVLCVLGMWTHAACCQGWEQLQQQTLVSLAESTSSTGCTEEQG